MIDLSHQRLKVWVFSTVIQISELLDTLLFQCAPDGGEFAFTADFLGWGEGSEEGGF